jgi:hypothetical protein
MVSAATFGAVSAPVSAASMVMVFADTRSGQMIWDDHYVFSNDFGGDPLNEKAVRALAQQLVRRLP